MNSVHEEEKRFKCSLCESSFSRADKLKTHISSVHEGKKPYQCDKCNESFAEFRILKNHTIRVHQGNEEEKWFKCSFCESRFSRTDSLQRHISSFHEGDGNMGCQVFERGVQN